MSNTKNEQERFPELFNTTYIDRTLCSRTVPLKVIVLGMPRTGTQSVRVALKALGFTDCYHMDSLFENPPDIDLWHRAFRAKYHGKGRSFNKADWDQLLGHCQAVCDLPTSAFIPELLEAYPDAKLIVTEREENEWYDSCQRTIHKVATDRSMKILALFDTDFLSKFVPLIGLMFSSMFPCPPSLWDGPEGRHIWIENYRKGIAQARKLVPPERRLDYNVEEGWGPLCEFLGVDVPKDKSFPHVNDSRGFVTKIGLIKRMAVVRVVKSLGRTRRGALAEEN